ncbi:hypothetical protein I3271_07070 [Photobacterium leiognathi]|uniref:hypothetical protein n=1 Tax=Photobacterium leiognathi TaxID=553611 RepID=UPI001EE05086|nr:hypothetical protein [Photobacterium leiognathi]MCG3884447.1 hypothetical protein [Photobacterium leiognathi]
MLLSKKEKEIFALCWQRFAPDSSVIILSFIVSVLVFHTGGAYLAEHIRSLDDYGVAHRYFITFATLLSSTVLNSVFLSFFLTEKSFLEVLITRNWKAYVVYVSTLGIFISVVDAFVGSGDFFVKTGALNAANHESLKVFTYSIRCALTLLSVSMLAINIGIRTHFSNNIYLLGEELSIMFRNPFFVFKSLVISLIAMSLLKVCLDANLCKLFACSMFCYFIAALYAYDMGVRPRKRSEKVLSKSACFA